ncbi:MAG: 50S ribosomal protein L18 [Patescibacteria group bacterium]
MRKNLPKKRNKSKIFGISSRPRVAVFRSNTFLYLQAIDDQKQVTIAAACSKGDLSPPKELAKKLEASKIKKIVFDRAGYKYHGKIKQLAEELRKAGLEF